MKPLAPLRLQYAAVLLIVFSVAARQLALSPLAAAQTGSHSLTQGAYSSMHMVLKRTFLNIRAVEIEIHFDAETQSELKRIASGKTYSDQLADQLAKVALEARDFTVQMHFLHDVGFGEFVSATRDNVSCALKSGLIPESEYQRVAEGTPQWFAPLQKREFKVGDQLTYIRSGDRLTTLLHAGSGALLLERTETGSLPRKTVLASYFAPCSDFREGLIRSLFEPQN